MTRKTKPRDKFADACILIREFFALAGEADRLRQHCADLPPLERAHIERHERYARRIDESAAVIREELETLLDGGEYDVESVDDLREWYRKHDAGEVDEADDIDFDDDEY